MPNLLHPNVVYQRIQADNADGVATVTWSTCDRNIITLSQLSVITTTSFAPMLARLEGYISQADFVISLRYREYRDTTIVELFADYSQLQQWVKNYLLSSDFDYLVWPELQQQAPRLLVFDMDSTFIEIEVIDELAKRHGVGDEVAAVTELAMRGELDFAASLRSRVACLKGLSETAITEIAKRLPLSKGVNQLVERCAEIKCPITIVSGGFLPFVNQLKTELGLFKVHANRLVIEKGCLSGDLEGDIVDAQAKADFLLALCKQLDIKPSQVMAIGDGANDLLMMQAAGFNLAYRAKPMVQQQANGRFNDMTLDRLLDLFAWRD